MKKLSALETFLDLIRIRKRLRRQYTLQNLRDYMKASTEAELIEAIQAITNIDNLKILWEAGLTSALQRAVSTRLEELTTRREE